MQLSQKQQQWLCNVEYLLSVQKQKERKEEEERRSTSVAAAASGRREKNVNEEFPYLVFAFPVFPVTFSLFPSDSSVPLKCCVQVLHCTPTYSRYFQH